MSTMNRLMMFVANADPVRVVHGPHSKALWAAYATACRDAIRQGGLDAVRTVAPPSVHQIEKARAADALLGFPHYV